jgi:hypothetical protein
MNGMSEIASWLLLRLDLPLTRKNYSYRVDGDFLFLYYRPSTVFQVILLG